MVPQWTFYIDYMGCVYLIDETSLQKLYLKINLLTDPYSLIWRIWPILFSIFWVKIALKYNLNIILIICIKSIAVNHGQ